MLNFKTIYFNFKYFPANIAVKFPVLISRNVVLRKCSGSIVIEGPVRPGLIRIGYGDVSLFDKKRDKSILEIFGQMVFKGSALLGHGTKISISKDGKIIFGNNFEITAQSSLVAYKQIEFGEDCLISWDVLFMDTDLHGILNRDGKVVNEPREIRIGDHVWIGCRSTILKGTLIPSGSIVAAGSTISKILEKENIHWKH